MDIHKRKKELSRQYANLSRDDLLWLIALETKKATMPPTRLVPDYDNYETIDTNQVIVTSRIKEAVNKDPEYKSGMLNGFLVKKNSEGFVAPLNRMERMKRAFKDPSVVLEPIRVEPVREVKGKMRYNVMDGRHRFAVSILKGLKQIPVEIV